VEEGAREARRTVRELRTLLVDIYPPVLQRSGLEPALADLVTGVTGVTGGGLDTRLDVQSGLALPPAVEALLYRTAQEALRNVRRHAHAGKVEVSIEADAEHAVLVVSDDGEGFSPEQLERRGNGHFGVRMMGDLVREAGGNFEVRSVPGQGTTVRVEAPLQ
jgi:signal transduction histidine kinase